MKNFKRKSNIQKTFELHLADESKRNLNYFINQELAYYNSIVDQLGPWMRSFPQDLLSFKGDIKRLWNTVAEFGLNVQDLVQKNLSEWPAVLGAQKAAIYSILKDDNKLRLTQRQLDILKIAASPGKIPALTRHNIASEIMKYMQGQAEVLYNAQQTDTLKNALQTLQVQSLDTKRHIQMSKTLIFKVEYNEDNRQTRIYTPFSKHPFVINGVNIKEIPHKSIVIRSPHARDPEGKWTIDLQDLDTYLVNLTDYNYRKRRK